MDRGDLEKKINNTNFLTTSRKISAYFLKKANIDEKSIIVDFLQSYSRNTYFHKAVVFCSIQIMKGYSQTLNSSINLAYRNVMKWYLNPFFRYNFANCLDMAGNRKYHLEALKQRIIACNLELYHLKRKDEELEKTNCVLIRHFERLKETKNFLNGNSKHPSKKIEKMLLSLIFADDDTRHLLYKLEKIGDLVNLPNKIIRNPLYTCVLDTNAISNRDASKHFMNSQIYYVTPFEVVLEISNWQHLQRIPWEFDAVEIRDVTMPIPREIDKMFSSHKGKPPSLSDKKIATLAVELKADVIISNDRDLWDSGMSYQIEKNFGHKIEVIRPSNFNSWLKRRK